MRKTTDTIENVRAFLGEDGSNLNVSFKGVYHGNCVYLVTDPSIDPSFPTGLPIFVLSSHYSHRFATPDETMELINGASTDIVRLAKMSGEPIAVDEKKKIIVHVLDEKLSTKEGCNRARLDIQSLFRDRRKKYVKRPSRGGIDPLGYDAYILVKNTGKNLSSEIDTMLFFIDEVVCYLSKDCLIFPYFKKGRYEKELHYEMMHNPGGKPEDPSILVYDDEMEFEGLLALVNRNR